jgi:dTDP-4-dehydrorhamnose reductase
MKIAVIGARGQLGGEICRQHGSQAIPLDIDTLDITQRSAVRGTLLDLRPEAVINCAAYTQVDAAESERGRCRTVNALAVEHLADACLQLDCPLVQVSTDYVFAGNEDQTSPIGEDHEPRPRGVYAETKYEGERAAARHEKHLIVRTCGLYARATDEKAHNFVKTILRLVGRNRPLKIVDDQRCTPSFTAHVARAILSLLGAGGTGPAAWGTYHVTNRGSTTWYEFAQAICRHAGMNPAIEPISTEEYGVAAPRPAYSVLDTSKYHATGGPPMPEWEEALAEFFDDWKLSKRSNGSGKTAR